VGVAHEHRAGAGDAPTGHLHGLAAGEEVAEGAPRAAVVAREHVDLAALAAGHDHVGHGGGRHGAAAQVGERQRHGAAAGGDAAVGGNGDAAAACGYGGGAHENRHEK